MGTLCQLLALPELQAEDGDEFSLLVELLEVAIRGEVVALPFSEWAGWTFLERQALATAGRRVRASRVAQESLADAGPEGRAQVLAEVDGGASQVRLALERQLERMVERMGGAR